MPLKVVVECSWPILAHRYCYFYVSSKLFFCRYWITLSFHLPIIAIQLSHCMELLWFNTDICNRLVHVNAYLSFPWLVGIALNAYFLLSKFLFLFLKKKGIVVAKPWWDSWYQNCVMPLAYCQLVSLIQSHDESHGAFSLLSLINLFLVCKSIDASTCPRE